MPLYGDSSSSDMDALQSLYMQVQQPQQAFTQWPQARSNTPYAPQQQQQGFEQWPNMQQPRSKTPPYPAQMQPQQAFNMQQQRSKTPPPYPSQVQPQQAFNMQQQRSKTPPPYPSQVQPQQPFDQWPNMQQQPKSNTPPYPPPHPQMQQPQQAFNRWPNTQPYPQMQQPPPSYPQMQQPQQSFDQWPNKQPPPTARPAPPTKVTPAIVPETSAIASSSSSPQQLVHSTLTEPVSATLARDIKRVAHNLRQIVVPSPNRVDPASALREWDLWGPFFFIICLSCILSSTASTNKSTVFAVVFAVLSAGAVSLTMNVVLLGGKLNFLQSLSVLGYCLFPLDVGAILCLAKNNKLYRSVIVLITLIWSSWSVYPFVSTAVRQSRKALAVYPVFLMYISMGFLVLANG